MAQLYPPEMNRRAPFGSDLDLQDAIGQKYPGAVRISLLIGVLAVSWSGVFVAALIVCRLIRHLTH